MLIKLAYVFIASISMRDGAFAMKDIFLELAVIDHFLKRALHLAIPIELFVIDIARVAAIRSEVVARARALLVIVFKLPFIDNLRGQMMKDPVSGLDIPFELTFVGVAASVYILAIAVLLVLRNRAFVGVAVPVFQDGTHRVQGIRIERTEVLRVIAELHLPQTLESVLLEFSHI